MSIIVSLVIDENDIKPHAWSLVGFYQDDGFGNCISTFTLCKKNPDIGITVSTFIDDEFNFVYSMQLTISQIPV